MSPFVDTPRQGNVLIGDGYEFVDVHHFSPMTSLGDSSISVATS
jgi:hypothetical protein